MFHGSGNRAVPEEMFENYVFYDVTALSADSAYVLGHRNDVPSEAEIRTRLFLYQNSTWQYVDADTVILAMAHGGTSTSDTVVITQEGKVYRVEGAQMIAEQPIAAASSFYRLRRMLDGTLYAASTDGALHRRLARDRWQKSTIDLADAGSPVLANAHGLSPASIDIALGDGTIRHYDGSACQVVFQDAELAFTDICCTRNGDLYATAVNRSSGAGALVVRVGDEWQRIDHYPGQPLLRVGVVTTESPGGSDQPMIYVTSAGGVYCLGLTDGSNNGQSADVGLAHGNELTRILETPTIGTVGQHCVVLRFCTLTIEPGNHLFSGFRRC